MAYELEVDLVVERSRNAMNRVSVQGKAREELSKYRIRSVVLDEHPGGGVVDVMLYGGRKNLIRYVHEVYSPHDPVDAEFHCGRIRKYSGKT